MVERSVTRLGVFCCNSFQIASHEKFLMDSPYPLNLELCLLEQMLLNSCWTDRATSLIASVGEDFTIDFDKALYSLRASCLAIGIRFGVKLYRLVSFLLSTET